MKKIGVLILTSLLITSCGSDSGGQAASGNTINGTTKTISTPVKIINNSDKDISRLRVHLNANLPRSNPLATSVDLIIDPPLLPGSQKVIDFSDFCDINVFVELSFSVFDSSSGAADLACGTTNYQCELTSFFATGLRVTRYPTECGFVL